MKTNQTKPSRRSMFNETIKTRCSNLVRFLFVLGLTAWVTMVTTWTVSAVTAGVLLAADHLSHQVVVFDLGTGAALGPFSTGATMDYLGDMTFGPDGHLYVLDGHFESGTNRVLRFDGRSGAFIDVFAQLGRDGWDGGITFGPEGHLYALCSNATVRKYDGTTGRLVGDVLSLIGLQLYSIAAGPDGLMYVTGGNWVPYPYAFGFIVRCGFDGSNVLSFLSGDCEESEPWALDCGTYNGPRKPVWGPDGHFYSANLNDGVVRQHDGQTGGLLGVFADPPGNGHVALAFGADGQLYISGVWDNTVYRADGTNGSILGTLTTNVQALALLSVPPPEIVAQPRRQIAREGGNASFTLAVRSVALASYQWSLDGVPIVGATNATLTLTGVTTNQVGNYFVVVSNIGGAVTSAMATLQVLQPPRLLVHSSLGGGDFEFVFTSQDGGIYAIESSTNLTEWVWVTTVANIWPGVAVREWQISGERQRFYRARLLP